MGAKGKIRDKRGKSGRKGQKLEYKRGEIRQKLGDERWKIRNKRGYMGDIKRGEFWIKEDLGD